MTDTEEKLTDTFKQKISSLMLDPAYKPLKRKQMIPALNIPKEQHLIFRKALKELKKERFLTIVHGEYILR
jgi:hypothetical protein